MTLSEKFFKKAQQVIPGGVNSPVRAFKSVGGTPPFIREAQGATLIDVDGKRYIDYVGSWGPMIAGHSHPHVVSAIKNTAEKGASFGAPTYAEVYLAQKIVEIVPSMEMVRLVNSGTEATMSALRLARAATKRDAILKFDGCYHGHADSLLVSAGSGAATFGVPSSPGVTSKTAEDTLTLPFNDLQAVDALFLKKGMQIAAIIVEPVAGNMGCVLPKPGFLEGLRRICDTYGALLIFDEVMTGFRVDRGGAQHYYNIKPDLTTLGKIIGGGLPVGAYGGRRDLMEQISPSGPVYQAGTLSGNPLATAAGMAMIKIISAPGFYETLDWRTQRLTDGISDVLTQAGVPHLGTRVGSMFGLFFTDEPVVENFEQAARSNMNRFNRWFHGMLGEGVYLAPSQYEAGFLSFAHTDSVIDETLAAAKKVAATLMD
ncbi:MAG: glutamate-1-semialdehyde 2,1-aminomutase [Magnetococcales bacterium]|nr:glutamate-1-semialdehyde 2,1-aminomutase [Magnetococcales bacterium]